MTCDQNKARSIRAWLSDAEGMLSTIGEHDLALHVGHALDGFDATYDAEGNLIADEPEDDTPACPHCRAKDCVPEVVYNNAENYGSQSFTVVCTECHGMLRVRLTRFVKITDIIASTADVDDWGEKACKK